MGLPSLRADSSYNGSKIPSPPVPKLSPLTDHTRGSHFLSRGGFFLSPVHCLAQSDTAYVHQCLLSPPESPWRFPHFPPRIISENPFWEVLR